MWQLLFARCTVCNGLRPNLKGGGLFSPSCGPCNQGLVFWGHTCGRAANGACLAPVHGCQKPHASLCAHGTTEWARVVFGSHGSLCTFFAIAQFRRLWPIGPPKMWGAPTLQHPTKQGPGPTFAAPQIANQVPNASQQVGLHQFSPWWRNLGTWRKQGAHSY